MAIGNDPRNELKNSLLPSENKRDIYISYNSLSQNGEVKSVSQAMHEYIKSGFAKFTPKKVTI